MATKINSGPLFRPVRKGSLQSEPLTDCAIAKIVKRYAGWRGQSVAFNAGHRFRAGLVTSAAQARAPAGK